MRPGIAVGTRLNWDLCVSRDESCTCSARLLEIAAYTGCESRHRSRARMALSFALSLGRHPGQSTPRPVHLRDGRLGKLKGSRAFSWRSCISDKTGTSVWTGIGAGFLHVFGGGNHTWSALKASSAPSPVLLGPPPTLLMEVGKVRNLTRRPRPVQAHEDSEFPNCGQGRMRLALT